MGCDIHMYRECLQANGSWTPLDKWDPEPDWRDLFTDRSYNLFGLIADGVRTRHPGLSVPVKGMPKDACPQIASLHEELATDAHNASWLTLTELQDIQTSLKDKFIEVSGMKDVDGMKKLMESFYSSGPTNWSLLYPYCQFTNDPNTMKFRVEVPAEFILGGPLERVINLFAGCTQSPDHVRVVFWFDN